MNKQEIAQIAIDAYEQGCRDTLNVFKNIIKTTEEHMDTLGKHMAEEFIKNMESKQ